MAQWNDEVRIPKSERAGEVPNCLLVIENLSLAISELREDEEDGGKGGGYRSRKSHRNNVSGRDPLPNVDGAVTAFSIHR